MATETITQAEVEPQAAQGQPESKSSLLGAVDSEKGAEQPVDDDGKEAGDEKAEAGDEKAKESDKDEIAEDAEFEVPEGEKVHKETLVAFRETARELGLTKTQAQTLLSKLTPVMRQQQEAAFSQAIDGWRQEAQKDPEIGGEKLKPALAMARKAVDHYFPAEFLTWLNESGIGNRADVIRGLAKVGTDLSSDAFVSGSARRAGQLDLSDPKSVMRKLFPNES